MGEAEGEAVTSFVRKVAVRALIRLLFKEGTPVLQLELLLVLSM